MSAAPVKGDARLFFLIAQEQAVEGGVHALPGRAAPCLPVSLQPTTEFANSGPGPAFSMSCEFSASRIGSRKSLVRKMQSQLITN